MLIDNSKVSPDQDIPSSFKEALCRTYLDNPCSVLPNALWKTIETMEDYQTSYTVEESEIVHLKIYNENKLMLCWHKEKTLSVFSYESINKLDFALLHQDHIENFGTTSFDHTQYFRFIHDHNLIPSLKSTPGVFIQNANPRAECRQIADLINLSYPNTHLTPETILKWTNHPVYLPELWIWVIDKSTGKPTGFGIAEYDKKIREGSLEWIQVLPEYRGLGLGKWFCTELLLRLKKIADFTTVSGELHNDTRPDILYRKVGFTGDDIWWVLRRKK